MKKVVLVVYSFDFLNKKMRVNFEKEIRDDILIQHKDKICVEFYNDKDIDLFNFKFDKMIKKRSPDSAIFVDISAIIMERMIRSIKQKVNKDVGYFFKNVHVDHSTKATKLKSMKEVSLFLTAINNKVEEIVA